jgi:hypothetical protein
MEMSSISRTNSRVREADRSVMRRAVATRNGAAVESRRARVHAQPEWGRRTWRLDPYNGRASRRRRPRRCASSAEEPKPWAALVLWAGDTDGGCTAAAVRSLRRRTPLAYVQKHPWFGS